MTEEISPPPPYASIPGLYLVDTNVLIHYVRRGSLQRRIEDQFMLQGRAEKPLISYVSEAEVRSFALQNNWGVASTEQLEFLLTTFRRVPIERREILDAYVLIDSASRAMGIKLGKNDAWIAATARVSMGTLLTTDHDFDHLNGTFLSVEWIDPKLDRPAPTSP